MRLHGRNNDTRGLEERQLRRQDDGARKKAKAAGLKARRYKGDRKGKTAQWKDADTDIPLLKQAEAEYAKLQ